MFFKTSFCRWWLAPFLFFLLFVVLLCFICHFYHICWKNLSKRPAVEPSDFWENRTRFQKQRFFLFCLFTFAFFIIFIFSLIFVCPFLPSLDQLGLICGRLWFNFNSVLVEVGERRRRKLQDLRGQTKRKTPIPTTHNPTISLTVCYFKSQPWGRSSILFNTFQGRRCPRRKATHKSRLGPCHNKRRKLQYFSILFRTPSLY